MRPTVAVVDLGAIARNVERIVELAAPSLICCVVKADAYGHGAVPVGQTALDSGASWLGVSLIEEGVELRGAGVEAPILVLSEPRPDEMSDVVAFRLTPTVYSVTGVAAFASALGSSDLSLAAMPHLKVDTGMNRVGLRSCSAVGLAGANDVEAMISTIEAHGIEVAGLSTHLAVADDPTHQGTTEQLSRFREIVKHVRPMLSPNALVHASNSAGLLHFPDARFDMVRVGIATYGIAPGRHRPSPVALEPALSLRTELSFTKKVKAGERVSYGLGHRFKVDTTLGTIPIGYADGLRRDAGLAGVEVLVSGRRCPIVGQVTMDQAIVDLGSSSSANVGDDVTVLGSQAGDVITATEMADRLGTIPYEILSGIGSRVRRKHLGRS